MIVSKAPVRISIGGGGTDLPFYLKYRKKGYLITSAIRKYVYVFVNKRPLSSSFKITYMDNEIVETVNRIKNNRVRETLKYLSIKEPLEIVTIADVPSNSGLGSSSSFVVALLNALYYMNGLIPSKKQLAEEAFHIEHDMVGQIMGKQDPYASSFGGIIEMKISSDQRVAVSPLNISFNAIRELEKKLILVYTGIGRKSGDVLSRVKKNFENDKDRIKYLDRIKDIGRKIKKVLISGRLDRFGKLLHYHWELKKRYVGTSDYFENIYDIAIRNGAIGGKLIGAGGGGFFMFYCENKKSVIDAMRSLNLRITSVRFDFDGVKVVYHD